MIVSCEFCDATLDSDVLGDEAFDEAYDDWVRSEVRLGDGTVDDVFRWCAKCEAEYREAEAKAVLAHPHEWDSAKSLARPSLDS